MVCQNLGGHTFFCITEPQNSCSVFQRLVSHSPVLISYRSLATRLFGAASLNSRIFLQDFCVKLSTACAPAHKKLSVHTM